MGAPTKRRLIVVIGLIGSLSATSDSFAQPFDPKAWFPLELGNAWHYEINADDATSTSRVITAARDSVVDGKRWVRFEEIYCAGYFCPGSHTWYHFTDDNYLLQGLSSTSPPDTFFATTPYSVFEITDPDDQTISLRDPQCEDLGTSAGVEENTSVLDSTRYTLLLSAGNIFCGSYEFVYKIGKSRVGGEGAGGTRLRGAYVNGYRYGEQNLLSTVLRTDESTLPQTRFDLFPNPASESVTVKASDVVEEIRIVDVTGRTVRVACCKQQEWTVDLAGLPSGMYFALLSTTRGTLSSVLIKMN